MPPHRRPTIAALTAKAGVENGSLPGMVSHSLPTKATPSTRTSRNPKTIDSEGGGCLALPVYRRSESSGPVPAKMCCKDLGNEWGLLLRNVGHVTGILAQTSREPLPTHTLCTTSHLSRPAYITSVSRTAHQCIAPGMRRSLG